MQKRFMTFTALNRRVLVITGPQGSGKSTLARELAAVQGSYQTIHAHELDSYLAMGDVLCTEPETVIVDEGVPSSVSLRYVTEMILADKVQCARRGQDPVLVNTPSFIFCTDSIDAIPLTSQDRRFVIEINLPDGATKRR